MAVQGELASEEWESEGQRRSAVKIVAERVQFLGAPAAKPAEQGPATAVAAADGGGEPPF